MVITVGDVGSYDDGAFGLEQIRGRFTNTRGCSGDQGNTVFDTTAHVCSFSVQKTLTSSLDSFLNDDGGDVFLRVVALRDREPEDSDRVQPEDVSPFVV